MGKFRIYNSYEHLKNNEFPKDKENGYLYIAEYNDYTCKMGCTTDVINRLGNIRIQSITYGGKRLERIAIRSVGTQYRDEEKKLHDFFSDVRIDESEHFRVSFDDAIRRLHRLGFVNSQDIPEAKYQELLEMTVKCFTELIRRVDELERKVELLSRN